MTTPDLAKQIAYLTPLVMNELLVSMRALSANLPYPEEAVTTGVLMAEVGTLRGHLREALEAGDHLANAAKTVMDATWRPWTMGPRSSEWLALDQAIATFDNFMRTKP